MASPMRSASGEKGLPASPVTRTPPGHRGPRSNGHRVVFLFLLVALVWLLPLLPWHPRRVLSWQQSPPSNQTDGVDNALGFPDWNKIEPDERLVWLPCYSAFGTGLRCARLTVPMDYNRPLNQSKANPKVHLALVLSPAAGRTEDPASFAESPLLINPGGPGGSGAFFVAASYDLLRNTVAGSHDILGFDPRGVGASTPKADCFEFPNVDFMPGQRFGYMNRATWQVGGRELGLVNSTHAALRQNEVRSRALRQLCKGVSDLRGNESIFKYINTANAAQDMLSIVEAWDEWRHPLSEEVGKSRPVLDVETVDQPSSQLGQANARAQSTHSLRGKLVYWGFSYGTTLGSVFISMFPERVGRVILDGVVESAGIGLPSLGDVTSLIDADKILRRFFAHCYQEGSTCPLYRPGDDAQSIEDRYREILASLRDEPRIVIDPRINLPVIVTASDIKYLVFAALYLPRVMFLTVAHMLNAILIGAPLDPFVTPPVLAALCGDVILPIWPDDSGPSVICSDAKQVNETLPELQSRFEDFAQVTSFADIWFSITLPCNGWEIEAVRPPRWERRFSRAPLETSFPVLVLSNQLDPVTPLHSALRLTQQLANASIVEQRAEGHCSLACTSLCTRAHIRAYLNEGRLPPAPRFDGDESGEWPTCECVDGPWVGETFGPHTKDSSILPSSSATAAAADRSDGNTDDSHQGYLEDGTSPYTAEEKSWMLSWTRLGGQFYPLAWGNLLGEQHPLRDAALSWVDAALPSVGGEGRCTSDK